jgi:phosphatidylserine/phosphatidylglycerophosphate/cardiolipin synthase-like enzyme
MKKLPEFIVLSLMIGLMLIAGCSNSNVNTNANVVKEQIVYETTGKEIQICFNPRENCGKLMTDMINKSTDVKCAFYDLNIKELITVLEEKKATVLIYYENKLPQFRYVFSEGLMHNKFCILDNSIVITGSFNPTSNDNLRNNNNMEIIYSEYLAKNYLEEFYQIEKSTYGRSKTKYTKIYLNNVLVENYFSPKDQVQEHIIDALKNAKKSIYFMTFSFTDDDIGNTIIDKYKSGLEIKGVFEKSQNNNYTEYRKMKDLGMNVIWDKNKYNMHHKVFIIDDETVIFGSYNPTKNADEHNDENILIVHDAVLAEKFLNEFDIVWNWKSS